MKGHKAFADALWDEISQYPQRLVFRVLLVVVCQQVNIALGGPFAINVLFAMAFVALYTGDLFILTGRSARRGLATAACLMVVAGVIAAGFPAQL